jgi:hypothetical protein
MTIENDSLSFLRISNIHPSSYLFFDKNGEG